MSSSYGAFSPGESQKLSAGAAPKPRPRHKGNPRRYGVVLVVAMVVVTAVMAAVVLMAGWAGLVFGRAVKEVAATADPLHLPAARRGTIAGCPLSVFPPWTSGYSLRPCFLAWRDFLLTLSRFFRPSILTCRGCVCGARASGVGTGWDGDSGGLGNAG